MPPNMSLRCNEIICADCAIALRSLPECSVDLAYLDPPFNTGRVLQSHAGEYDDDWGGLDGYLQFIRPRLASVRSALKPEGSILLHCDWRTVHHLRLMLDDLFGREQFVNHLIWSYGLGGSSPRRFARKHDDILFYAKSQEYFFDPPMIPATSNRMRGQSKKATDVIDIPAINNMAAERVGYPTQKPLALLEMLVGACCPPGGLVLDPFCGSGTTLVAAQRLGRRWLGIDVNPDAVAIARQRLTDGATLLDSIGCTPSPTGRGPG
jgi:DNA modification methylase